ncbi:hypothetical protein AX16_003357 [Volvariella volvacea WC 439]|nr:hypothetical protein AX16_003357 [Volvariella volvacea WC 439]
MSTACPPLDVLRDILAFIAKRDKKTAVALCAVSHTAREWTLPILYEVVSLDGHVQAQSFLFAITSNTLTPTSRYTALVKSISFNRVPSEYITQILKICHGIDSLALWGEYSDYSRGGTNKNPLEDVLYDYPIRPKRISLDLGFIPLIRTEIREETQPGEELEGKAEFKIFKWGPLAHPIFSNVTHLDLGNEFPQWTFSRDLDRAWGGMPVQKFVQVTNPFQPDQGWKTSRLNKKLPLLPNLTHLSIHPPPMDSSLYDSIARGIFSTFQDQLKLIIFWRDRLPIDSEGQGERMNFARALRERVVVIDGVKRPNRFMQRGLHRPPSPPTVPGCGPIVDKNHEWFWETWTKREEERQFEDIWEVAEGMVNKALNDPQSQEGGLEPW